ncbi:MAG: hypothetical protein M3R02_30110 [Chloroflexota bacterium]|nr:hypothetical protein [Chloroflexota bacterium]
MSAVIHPEPEDVESRLAALGLTERVLLEAVREGLLAWASCTPHHPLNFPGLAAWGETVRALRDGLVPLGWTSNEDGGLPRVVNAAGRIALTAATGNEGTGRLELPLSTNNNKGARTAKLAAVNHEQAELFARNEYVIKASHGPIQLTTWMLLFHRDEVNRELRCELACPLSISQEGFIDAWSERIILSPTPFDDDTITRLGEDDPQGPSINVKIKRRA